jgi:hypothetical protein
VVLSYLQFHCKRLFRAQPVAFALLVVGISGVGLASLLYYKQLRLLGATQDQLKTLKQTASEVKPTAAPAELPAKSEITFPQFDGVQLVHTLNELAAESRTPVDDVGYALDDSSSLPYLRYRITLGVSAPYPVIREFGARLMAEMPNVSMDSISCKRSDAATIPLTCELQFSAFYQRAAHG